MKKYIIIVLFLVLCASPAHAMWAIGATGGNVAAAASCTTSNDKALFSPTVKGTSSASGVDVKAIKFTTAATKTITGYLIYIQDSNQDGDGLVTASLYNHDAVNNWPDETSQVTGSAKALGHASIPDSATATFFELATPLVLPAGTYWLTTYGTNGIAYNLYYDTSSGNTVAWDESAGSWSGPAADTSYNMEVWGCD